MAPLGPMGLLFGPRWESIGPKVEKVIFGGMGYARNGENFGPREPRRLKPGRIEPVIKLTNA